MIIAVIQSTKNEKKILSRGEPGESYFGDISKMKESCLELMQGLKLKSECQTMPWSWPEILLCHLLLLTYK